MHDRLAITWTDKGTNYRRWIPDAMTALLLLRLPQQQPPVTNSAETEKQRKQKARSAMERDLRNYLRKVSETREQCPETLHEFLDAALLDLEVRLPRALTQYAAGRQTSHSLRPRVWWRLMGKPPVADTSAATDRPKQSGEPLAVELEELASDRTEDAEIEGGDVVERYSDPKWLSDLRETLQDSKSKSRSEKGIALTLVNGLLKRSDTSPVLQIFAGFAKELLEQHAKSRKGNTLKTLRVRIVAVATRLPALVNVEQAAALNSETLQAAYQQILEDASSENQRQKLAGHLRAFHRYLVRTHFVDPIDEGEAFASANEDLTVDANLIIEDEYQLAATYLLKWPVARSKGRPPDERLRTIARLLLMLGFRCGLRRMEALKLQRVDFNEQDPAELLIRPWEQRRLKTPNATRKLPIHALLSKEELSDLRKWKAQREEECGKESTPSPYLFAIPGMEYTSIPENLVFPLIHEALRAVTQDQSLRFHHLRHSFSSWITYALMQPPETTLPTWLERWPKANEWIAQSGQLHKSLYGNAHPTRRHLFAVSRLLGHSSPEMSLSHYVHINDQLLALWLEKQTPPHEPKILIAASGLKPSTVYRMHKNHSCWAMVERLWKHIPAKERWPANRLLEDDREHENAELNPQRQPTVSPDNNVLLELDRLWLLLYFGTNEKQGTEDLAHRFGLSEVLIGKLLAVAEEVEQRRNKDDPNQTWLKPREGEEMEVIRRFAPPLWKLLSTNPDLSRAILNHYLEGIRNHRNGLEFLPENKKLAKQYLTFLGKLGVKATELLIVRYAAEENSTAWELWAKALQLGGNEAVQPARPPSSQKAKSNVVGIKAVFETVDKNGKVRTRASYGMSYLLTLAGIWTEAQKPADIECS